MLIVVLMAVPVTMITIGRCSVMCVIYPYMCFTVKVLFL